MAKQFYIKERNNPQMKRPYFVACGRMTKKAAKDYETPGYGSNVMHAFPTQATYEERLAELRAQGEQVQ